MFIETDLESVLGYLNKLQSDTKPQWGKMSAQRMVEHLTDMLWIARGETPQEVITPPEKLEKVLAFLTTDLPMGQNIQVPFAKENTPLRNEELELAVDEFVDAYLEFQEEFESNPNKVTTHAIFGPLNYEQWNRLNQKHLTHHFTQFGLID